MLEQRILVGYDSRFREIEAAGGLYIVWTTTDVDAARAEVLRAGIRALEVHVQALDFLRDLPLEFLFLNAPLPRIEPVASLTRLRSLAAGAWQGALDFTALPALEWFGVFEPERRQLDPLFRDGHAQLRHLSVARWKEDDLRPLAGLPRLTHLNLSHARRFASLGGIAALPELRVLELESCSALASLAGIDAADDLEHVGLATCNRIDDIAPLGCLPALRAVQIELRQPPSLMPLVELPTLESVWLVGGRRPHEEYEALRAKPSLVVLQTGRSAWLRRDGEWLHVLDIYAMTPEQTTLYDALHERRNAIKAW